MRHKPKNQERSPLSVPILIPSFVFALAVALVGLLLLAPRTASAQASAGITGTVTDSTGAVVRGAKVSVVNEATSVSDKTVTESAGTYSFKGLLPGHYTVTVEASGFKKSVQHSINIEVSSTATIDVSLVPGGSERNGSRGCRRSRFEYDPA